MPLSIINGHYRIQNSEPDGDSVHFHPSDPNAFTTLHLAAHLNSQGGTQLRLEAIDALETHYSPRVRGGFLHQPLAHAAAAQLLQLLGFTDVQRDGERVTSATPEQTEGYILTRFADKYGRAVSFAYAGESDHQDLSRVFVDEQLLGQSVNFQLVTDGLAYPTYYSKLFPDPGRGPDRPAAASTRRSDLHRSRSRPGRTEIRHDRPANPSPPTANSPPRGLAPALGRHRPPFRKGTAMSTPQAQAQAQVTLSLPILRKGQHAGEPPVERLQFMLNFVKGADDLDVDGIFGPKTEAAVRDFQHNENLSVDGIVGQQTWTTLLRRWLLFSQPG